MADNYLENQYEQYQARKAAWERDGCSLFLLHCFFFL